MKDIAPDLPEYPGSTDPIGLEPDEDADATSVSDAGSALGSAIRWALESRGDAARAAADWLAADVDPNHSTAEGLLTDSSVSLLKLRKAKSVYKTMRIIGETSNDRRLGARLYAAAIAAGLVWHGRRISQQSDEALRRAFQGILDDPAMQDALRQLAGKALCVLYET